MFSFEVQPIVAFLISNLIEASAPICCYNQYR